MRREAATGLGAGLLRVLRATSPRRRRQAALLLGLMMAAGVFELLSVGAIAPLLAAVAAQEGRSGLDLLPGWMRALTGHGVRSLGPYALAFAGLAMAAAGVRVLLTWATQKFVFRLSHDLETQAYGAVLARPYAVQVTINSSETIAGLDKAGLIAASVFLPILAGLSSFVIAGFILGALVIVRPLDALIASLGFAATYVVVALVFRGSLGEASRAVANGQTQRVKALQEGLGGIRDVILDGSQAAYVVRFSRLNLALRDAQAAVGAIGASPRFAVEGAGMIVIALLVVWLSGRPGGVVGALPLLGVLALAAQRLLPLLQQIYNSWSQVAASRHMLDDVAGLLEASRIAVGAPTAEPLPFRREISLQQASLRYAPDGPLVLDQMTLSIRRGDRVGIVGRSGSGKSSLMDLLLGLLEPGAGAVWIDDVRLDAATRGRWRRQVAHVPQSIFLADASILENIALGQAAGEIDEARARAAARQADLDVFVDALPEGLATLVGERGVRLSGGQRQRIGIARALYRRASLLVFDEATSALDDATETSVLDAIHGLGRDITVILVAHRAATLRRCDYVLRVENGRIVPDGARNEPASGEPVKASVSI